MTNVIEGVSDWDLFFAVAGLVAIAFVAVPVFIDAASWRREKKREKRERKTP